MKLTWFRGCVAAACLVGAASTQACYVEEDVPVRYAGYEPAYYDGYVVYYDSIGRPFYYVNGVPLWVPLGSPYYAGLANHWRVYGPAYGGWYAHYGYRYRGFRRGR